MMQSTSNHRHHHASSGSSSTISDDDDSQPQQQPFHTANLKKSFSYSSFSIWLLSVTCLYLMVGFRFFLEGTSPRLLLLWTSGNNTSTSSGIRIQQQQQQQQQHSAKQQLPIESVDRLIQPGNHTNIPDPKSRIGPNGEHGYIQDPKWLLKQQQATGASNRLRFDNRTSACEPFQRYPVDLITAPQLKKIRDYKNSLPTASSQDQVKLFCSIYTYGGGVAKTNAIADTWGKRCDGLLFASDHSNVSSGHVHLPTNSKHAFAYQGMIQRTRTILSYLYDNYLEDYDFYHFCGDDTYLIIENLRHFVATQGRQWEEAGNLFFAGFWMSKPWMGNNSHYLGGGSGYTMSRATLKAFVEGPLQTCNPYGEGSVEDVWVSECFREYLTPNITRTIAVTMNNNTSRGEEDTTSNDNNIINQTTITEMSRWIDTRDENGRHRYHQLSLYRHTYWPKYKPSFGPSTRLIRHALNYQQENYGFPVVTGGDDYISPASVAFHQHYSPDELRVQDMLLYDTTKVNCDANHNDDPTYSYYTLDRIPPQEVKPEQSQN